MIEGLTVPTLLVDETKVRQNVRAMLERAKAGKVKLRPHFKTHQSIEIARWMRQEHEKYQQEQEGTGAEATICYCTVSSLSMAVYFSKEFKDITVAFPFNMHEIQRVRDLIDSNVNLGLTVENIEAIDFLEKNLIRSKRKIGDDTTTPASPPLRLWIKVDAGYHRTGVRVQDTDQITTLLRKIQNSSSSIEIAGILIHGGHSYDARGDIEIAKVHRETLDGVSNLQKLLSNQFPSLEYSVCDTPACSTQHDFTGCAEIRPGNYVFYDVEQSIVGSCKTSQIAVCLACPVVAKHSDRNQIVIYGGAVHLSKDNICDQSGNKIFGLPVSLLPSSGNDENPQGGGGWGDIWPDSRVIKVSQEHGIIQTTNEVMAKVQVGDFVGILPVHSCLTADCMGEYLTLDGKILDHFRSHKISLCRR